jgi:UDP-N-acetylglucosamine diphosphorylase/glucosamine-1-phosphate N-acetyltransferase
MLKITLFEPKRVENFYPFSIMHTLWELRTGPFMIFEKYQKYFTEETLNYFGRKKHLESFLKRYDLESKIIDFSDYSHNLIIDSTVIPDKKFLNDLFFILNFESYKNKESLIFKDSNGIPFAIKSIDDDNFRRYLKRNETIDLQDPIFSNYKSYKIKTVNTVNYLWETLDNVESSINNDLGFFKLYRRFNKQRFMHATALNPEEIYAGEDVRIGPGVVLDASEGPIIIDDYTKIMPQATIIGPCYIGKNNIVKIGAKIYENNAFGDWCKIGGEIENTIIQSYSNKQHEGFLGHSYLCEWVNFGADTNCSDLKNTYSNIKVNLNGETVDTERMFLGVLCGDHTKTGINSMFTTGTVAGICGILVRDWFLPSMIKSFSWGGKADSPNYKLSKAIETAKIVMARRDKELLEEEIELMQMEYNKDKI